MPEITATTVAPAVVAESKPDGPYAEISRLYRQILRGGKPSRDPRGPIPHPESWIEFDQLGRKSAEYRTTFPFSGDYIDAQHRVYSACKTGMFGSDQCIDIGIEGYLSREDALKLYEMAYFCRGDILELGTHKGLSGSIMLQALHASNKRGKIHTVDVDPPAVDVAKKNIGRLPGADRVNFNLAYAGPFMQQAISQGRKFGFIFVDHWHGYDATYEAASLAKQLIEDDGFVMFHDYTDPSNRDPNHVYGVYQAVAEVILPCEEFVFYGNFGACALFRRESDQPKWRSAVRQAEWKITTTRIWSKLRNRVKRPANPIEFTRPRVERAPFALKELSRRISTVAGH